MWDMNTRWHHFSCIFDPPIGTNCISCNFFTLLDNFWDTFLHFLGTLFDTFYGTHLRKFFGDFLWDTFKGIFSGHFSGHFFLGHFWDLMGPTITFEDEKHWKERVGAVEII